MDGELSGNPVSRIPHLELRALLAVFRPTIGYRSVGVSWLCSVAPNKCYK